MSNVYNKLVRDNIPEIIARDGGVPVTRTLRDTEYKRALRDKLTEEVEEVRQAKGKKELVKEIADVEEILRAIRNAFGVTKQEIEQVRKKRLKERGGFKKKIFLVKIK